MTSILWNVSTIYFILSVVHYTTCLDGINNKQLVKPFISVSIRYAAWKYIFQTHSNMNKTILLPSVLFHLPTIKLRWWMMHLKQLHLHNMSTCGEKAEQNHVVGWVWSKQKSLNPTLNIWNKICQVMLSSVFQFLHKSQLLFLIRNIQVFFHLILVIRVKFEEKKN